MHFRSLLRAYLAVVFMFSMIASLSAQTSGTGGLSGTVTDPSGATIPNVAVTATNLGTGQARMSTSSADGTYKFGLLPPGNYRVQFEATGFQTVAVPSITINVTETAVLDRRLEVGSQSQEITVQGEAETTIQTSDATVGTVMAGTHIADLPLTSRNYTNLLGLSAGANVGVYDAANLGRGTQDIAVNGGATTQNNFQMDGVSINVASGSGSGVDNGGNPGLAIANPDSIQEFKIQTSLFDAGYGRKPGANVNVVTKSGTNQFHGSAFEFFRNTALNANDFFRSQSPPVNGVASNGRQILNQNQYGGVIGGPIKKDKLFFFTSYQETWQKNGIAVQGYSAATLLPIFPGGDRSNTAALTSSLGATFCPTGTDGGISSTAKTSAGAVQVACNGSNINPVAISLLQLKNPDGSYYIPSSGSVTSSSGTTAGQNSTFSIPAVYREHQALGNLDYVINGKNTLSGRWFYSTDPTQVPFGCAVTSKLGTSPSNCLPGTNGSTQYTDQNAIVKLTTIVTNNLVNEARISLQRGIAVLGNAVPYTDNQVGISPILPGINVLDQIVVTGFFSIGTYYVLDETKRTTSWEAADQVSWNHGKQTIRAGFEFERDRINAALPGDSIGALTFQTFQDFLLGLPGCAAGTYPATCNAATPGGTNGTASSNISNTGTFSAVAQPTGVHVDFRVPAGYAFVQDDIKFSPRFTLNLGLRWEYNGLVRSEPGELTNVWPSLINTVPIPGSTPATGTLAGFVVPANYNFAVNPAPPVGGLFQSNHLIGPRNNEPLTNFAPRVGFAWQPTGSDRFVVRGGFGYFYDRLTDGNYATTYFINNPVAAVVARSGQANYFSSFAQPFAPTPLGWSPRWVNFANGTSSNLSEYIQAENFLTPLVDEWNMNIQYEFKPTWVLELGYVGSHGIHQAVSNTQQINQAQLVGNPLGTNTITAPGIASGLVTTNLVANASLRVPYLGFGPGGITDGTTNGDDKFNSLQATVRKRFSHGLTLQAAYTWSKSLTTGSLNMNNSDNFGSQYGLNSSYHPQRLAINYDWELPLGHPDGWRGKLVNGWSLSGVTIVQDGTPLTITDTRGGTIFGFGPGSPETSTAEYCPGMTAANAASTGSDKQRLGGANGGQGWFNKTAFYGTGTNGGCAAAGASFPTVGDGTAYGNSSLGIVLGPGQFNWDMSLTKTTTVGGIREDATLQFRTEFFNAFNHAQFNNPAVVDVSKSTFGQITSTSVNPRLIQFALKYAF
ncbi:MAG: carboxypeptidase-like regulatory domain-containing protein [Candidatus Acidiferrales bacterium]